ncbi:MAG: sporulation protein YunB [Eubacteriales bacterium]
MRIPASVEPSGSAETTVKSSLVSAGINQSLHKITLSVRVSVTAMLLISTVDVDTETDVCIAETVIIGDVPKVFLGGKN